MGVLGGIGNDHPDGPDELRDLVWMTALHGLKKPVEELPEELLFERPSIRFGEIQTDAKLDRLLGLESTGPDCE